MLLAVAAQGVKTELPSEEQAALVEGVERFNSAAVVQGQVVLEVAVAEVKAGVLVDLEAGVGLLAMASAAWEALVAGEESLLPILEQEDQVFLVGVLALALTEDQEVLGEEAVQGIPWGVVAERPWEALSLS